MISIKRKNTFKIIPVIMAITAFVFMFFLTSCVPIVELNKRGLVQTIGLDYKDNMFTTSFQILNLCSTMGGKDGGESKSDDLTIKSEGITIMDAMKKANLQQDRDLYYRVTNVIILGKNILSNKQVFKQTIDVLNQLYIANPNIYVVMSDKEASEIVEAELQQNSMLADFIKDMLQNSEKQSYIKKVYLTGIINSLNDINKSISIPVIIKQKEEDSEEESLEIKSVGVINNGRLRGEISTGEMKYIRLLENKKTQLSFNFLSKKYGRYNFDVLKRHVSINSAIIDDKPHFDINLDVDSTLVENDKDYNIQNLSSQDIINLQSNQKEYLEYNISKLLSKLLKQYKVDLCYFTNNIYRNHYDYWLAHKDNWEDVLSKITISINVKTHIVRSII